ncbi:MAG TPA: ribosomal L7Ae/L30e/S12e/Gadd45 family protein [Candidatus Nanoarchaeia archaeon]|nr:ribosomal L7Ae/L30e/S12e/Gadd45 family protein [Candidatus Nanoarchaeia archaeon]
MVNADKALEAIEIARTTGKLRKGSNEVTKAIERGQAKLVVVAQDVTPKEIVMHIPLLSKEKGVLCIEVPSKDNLGASAGLEVGTAAVVIIQEGDSKKIIEELKKAE